ncbi:DUF3578 domain-containing protein [Streptomyces sp. T-3]|nr:DUF3578 domain-containing protein [Streptomyces sp. T-3]
MAGALPRGCLVRGYGGSGSASSTPWIGVFDPDVTSDPKQGLYLAYIFSVDLRSVYLTLQQGVTRLEERIKAKRKLERQLKRRSNLLQQTLPSRLTEGWREQPRFGGRGWRPQAYEAANVVARRYDTAALPDEAELREDLSQAVGLLQRAGAAESAWWIEDPSGLTFEFHGGGHGGADSLAGFHPKDSRDYIANIAARQQVKKRDHEALIAAFGPHIAARGYVPITDGMHPKDLVLRRAQPSVGDPSEWLVEAKVVRGDNPTVAVREAVGQLYEYRYFLYGEQGLLVPKLIGLFTEDIRGYSGYLESHGIASIWRSGEDWDGSSSAVRWGMVR